MIACARGARSSSASRQPGSRGVQLLLPMAMAVPNNNGRKQTRGWG